MPIIAMGLKPIAMEKLRIKGISLRPNNIEVKRNGIIIIFDPMD
jgi:hypothetical protein